MKSQPGSLEIERRLTFAVFALLAGVLMLLLGVGASLNALRQSGS